MSTAPADERREQAWRRARHCVEVVVATALVIVAAYELYMMRHAPPEWMPFGLLALALLIYSLRGRELTELAISKDGLSWKVQNLEQRTVAAEQRAEEAVKTAEFSKTVATQIGPSLPEPAEAAEGLRSAWAHPGLKPTRKPPKDDPQKGQWGSEAVRNGRILDAEVTPTDDPEWYEVRLEVRSTDPSKPLTGRVRFHLHDSYRVSKVTVKPKNGVAAIDRYAYGAFTVGAEVENEPDTFLELDLVDVDAPAKFKAR